MTWQQLKCTIDAQYNDATSALLEVLGAQAITVKNAGNNAFFEAAFPETPTWQSLHITALFPQSMDIQPIVLFLQQHHSQQYHTELPITVEQLQDQNWETVYLQHLKPIQITSDFWVCPTWCQPENPKATQLFLDPGLAFGTGAHETTSLCLRWIIEQDVEQKSILDYGCGSGILAIGALLNGATKAVGVDIDPFAVESCKENAIKNNCEAHLSSYLPHELNQEARFDIIIANILSCVLIDIADTLTQHLKKGGTLLLTGILESQTASIKLAYPQFSFTIIQQDSWCLLIGNAATKKGAALG